MKIEEWQFTLPQKEMWQGLGLLIGKVLQVFPDLEVEIRTGFPDEKS